MKTYKRLLAVLLCAILIFTAIPAFATNEAGLKSGVRLYGYRIWDDDTNLSYAWISFTDDNPSNVVEEHVEENAFDDFSDMSAGAYFNGNVYGFAENGYFYRVNTTDWSREALFGDSTAYNGWSDMTFDYTTNTLYAIAYTLPWESSEESDMTASYLVTIDLYDYEITEVAQITTGIITLAADDQGQLYGVALDNCLYEIDKVSGACRIIGSTGNIVEFAQSMCYDYNTDTMYWAHCNISSGTLCSIDLTDASVTHYGTIGGNSEVTSLFIIPENEPLTPVTGIDIVQETVAIDVGMSATLYANILPQDASERRYTWSSSNEAVAIVDANGVVFGTGVGEATITATSLEGGFTDTCVVTVSAAAISSDFVKVDTVESGEQYIIVTYCDGVAYALVNRNANTTNSSAWGAVLVPVVLSQDDQYVLAPVDSNENIDDIVWLSDGDYTDGFSFRSITSGKYFGGLPLCNWTAIIDTPDYWLPINDFELTDGGTVNALKSLRAEAIDPTETRIYMGTTSGYYNATLFDYVSARNACDVSFYKYVGGEEEYTLGDINGDGIISSVDALFVLRYVMELETLTESQLLAADFDQSGDINAIDALLILRSALE